MTDRKPPDKDPRYFQAPSWKGWNERYSDYNRGQKAFDRLQRFATDTGSKITWELEMEKHFKIDDGTQQGGV